MSEFLTKGEYLHLEDADAKAMMVFTNAVVNKSLELAGSLGMTKGDYLSAMCTVVSAAAELHGTKDALASVMEAWVKQLRDPSHRVAFKAEEVGRA